LADFHTEIKPHFENSGAYILCSSEELVRKVSATKAFIFDWDGVFNAGIKADNNGSPFSEVDSMGLNMLRFSFYLKYGFIPNIYIITGENNQPALHLSKREHFAAAYLKAKQKTHALKHFLQEANYSKEEVAFVYDDILDLGLASEVGLRFYIPRDANPLLSNYIKDHNLAEYYTGNTGSNNAVREVCELCIGALGNYNDVVKNRVENSVDYQSYLRARNNIATQYYKFNNDEIAELNFS
jgi:3-deoxy-D-manno-octulosonate 8-phosphate phosphatase (KDO 8-P phosphatase)